MSARWRLSCTVLGTVLLVEAVLLKDTCRPPTSYFFDAASVVVALYLTVLTTRWFR